MAKSKKSAKEVLKWKKKKWVKIVSPKDFGNVVLGESLVMKPETLVGKTIEVSLMSLKRDVKKQNVNVKFLITNFTNNQANTKLLSFKMIPSFIKRMIRRSKDRIDLSFVCQTKDNLTIRIKPLLITMNNTSNSVLTTLRKKAEFLITQYVKKNDYNKVMDDIINYRIQKELKKQLKTIYPLRLVEIRIVQLQKKDQLLSQVNVDEIKSSPEDEKSNETDVKQTDNVKKEGV
ncbi:MAG: hypothetical protein ACLFPJ_01690 [Candidatus Woesearchaeota archaeon]